jgi:hypothetical protein
MTSTKATAITLRAAVRILMQSPFYFRYPLADRKALVLEFCAMYFSGGKGHDSGENPVFNS